MRSIFGRCIAIAMMAAIAIAWQSPPVHADRMRMRKMMLCGLDAEAAGPRRISARVGLLHRGCHEGCGSADEAVQQLRRRRMR